MFSLMRSDVLDRDLFRLPQMMNQLFENGQGGSAQSPYSPRVDVRETDTAYEFAAECPGLDRETLNVTVENGILSLSGEKKSLWEKQEGNHLRERSFGKFSRSFRLPREVNTTKIEAQYTDGILHVRVPKSAAAQPVRIAVK